jgi:hypothetical protein
MNRPRLEQLAETDMLAVATTLLLLLNYLAWLLVPGTFAPVVAGLLVASMIIFAGVREISMRRLLIPLVITAGFFIIPLSPIVDWDARSIWLFHAKRMVFDGSIVSRFDGYSSIIKASYPDFVPATIASFARLTGVWNEILPKVGVFVCLIPPILVLLNRVNAASTKILLLGVILFVTDRQLLTGYMDAPLALYVVAALALLIEAHWTRQERALIPAAVLLGAAASIKQEGLAMAAVTLIPWLFLLWSLTSNRAKRLRYILVVAGSFLPLLVWITIATRYGVSSELVTGGGFSRAVERMRSEEFHVIRRALWDAVSKPLVLLLLIAYWRRTMNLLAMWFCLCYTGVLAVTYLMTPYDVAWQLGTSIQRVTLVLRLLAAVVAVLEFDRWVNNRWPPVVRLNQEAAFNRMPVIN